MIEVLGGAANTALSEAAFFPFDDVSIPFTAGLRLRLVHGKESGGQNPVVVARGEEGEPDDSTVRYYGTIIQIGDELHMWYQARGSLDPPPTSGRGLRRLCYAMSRDGVSWQRPKLGLVEYNGSTQNNIVDIQGGECVLATSPIIYDPEDPDPDRRFKMNFERGRYKAHFAVAYSPDGLRWTESPRNPVGPWLEQGGLIKFNGCYYVNGQGGSHYGALRKLVTFASYDFEHWTQASSLGFRRDPIPPGHMPTEPNTGEEIHVGAGVWNRGNVIIGVYGMWHGHPAGVIAMMPMDLGLVVSNDALHYREPVPDFRFIPASGEIGDALGLVPTLMQGQGMYNVGDQTMYWYESWRDGDVRLATWPRDRLGYFEAFSYGQLEWAQLSGPRLIDLMDETPAQFISCPIRVGGAGARLYANVDRVSEQNHLTVEVLDMQFRPLAEYAGDQCIPLRAPGLREPVVWKDRDSLRGIDGPVRVRVRFPGLQSEGPRVYAVYVAEE